MMSGEIPVKFRSASMNYGKIPMKFWQSVLKNRKPTKSHNSASPHSRERFVKTEIEPGCSRAPHRHLPEDVRGQSERQPKFNNNDNDDHNDTGVYEENTPFVQALSLQSSSRNCNPAPDLAL